MHSSTPKVLHEIGGRPMLGHVIATAEKLNPNKIWIVHSEEKALFTEKFSQSNNLCVACNWLFVVYRHIPYGLEFDGGLPGQS